MPMKRLTIPALIAGLLLGMVLIASAGAREVGLAVASVGWGALLIVLVRAVVVTLAGIGWFVIFPSGTRPSLAACLLLRWVREGANTLLPLTQVGGEFIGARCLTFFGVGGALSGASVIVDVMMQAATQFMFTLTGLMVLIALGGDEAVIRFVAIGLALAAPALIGFYIAQRRAGHHLLRTALTRMAGARQWLAFGAVDALYDSLRLLYARRSGLVGSAVIHLGSWFLAALEVWIALAFMGHPVSYAEALVIESLTQAVRGAAFAVPGALGVQEGGLIALCAIFGVPAQSALALSLVKRVADVAIGAPGLLAWQVLESRRALRGGDRAATGPLAQPTVDAPSSTLR